MTGAGTTSALAIVDTHLHFLDLGRFSYPWLDHPAFASLRDGYLPDDWAHDAAGREVVAAVHVQAEVDHGVDPVEETAWLASLEARRGADAPPLVYVAYADLRAPDLERALERQLAHDAVRGIRQEAWFDPRSTRADVPRENLLDDPAWRDGLRQLARRGLSFDLLVWHHQLVQAADVFAAVPELTVVLEHCGLPPLGDPAAVAAWRAGLRRFAAQVPRATLKISALNFMAASWRPEDLRAVVLEAIEVFGPARCMLGSNFPVERTAAAYGAVWDAYEAIASGLSNAERTALFSGTAIDTYRIRL